MTYSRFGRKGKKAFADFKNLFHVVLGKLIQSDKF